MPQQRSSLLLILLVTTTLALLAWLGTYLIRDAERRTDTAMQAILSERLSVANHQIINDLRKISDRLDAVGEAVEDTAIADQLRNHPWVTSTWEVDADGSITKVLGSDGGELSDDDRRRLEMYIRPLIESIRKAPEAPETARSSDSNEDLPLAQASELKETGGLDPVQAEEEDDGLFQSTAAYSLDEGVGLSIREQIASGLRLLDEDFGYWRRLKGSSLVIGLLDRPALLRAIFDRLPQPGLEPPPGRMVLATSQKVILHQWGKRLSGSDGKPAASRRLSEPLGAWILSYAPSSQEFPKPYLFPIILGICSGTLLVLALAYLYFHETAREIHVAQQRVTFVNQISHELRTPLTNIQLYAEMAHTRIEETADRIAMRHLGVVQAETSRLNRLIQNVLNYARQQRNKLSIQATDVSLDDVVGRVVEHWRPLLESKGFEIDVHLDGPPHIQADADAVEQILGNLISNVDKYAPYGRWIGIYSRVKEDRAEVIIEDRGPGIPATRRRSVFEPFERLRSDLNEGVSGTGIGLTIARELALLHGGHLSVCRSYKEGARFILQLPLPKKP